MAQPRKSPTLVIACDAAEEGPPVQEGLKHAHNFRGLPGQPGCCQGLAAEPGVRHVDDICHGQHRGQLLGAGGYLQDQLRLRQGTWVSKRGPLCQPARGPCEERSFTIEVTGQHSGTSRNLPASGEAWKACFRLMQEDSCVLHWSACICECHVPMTLSGCSGWFVHSGASLPCTQDQCMASAQACYQVPQMRLTGRQLGAHLWLGRGVQYVRQETGPHALQWSIQHQPPATYPQGRCHVLPAGCACTAHEQALQGA